MKDKTCLALIVAGGKGLRLDPAHPKQFLPLCGKPVLVHTLLRFYESRLFDGAVVVLPKADVKAWPELCAQYGLNRDFFTAVAGGETRFDSVGAGLSALCKRYHIEAAGDPHPDLWVAVHDGVRPLISTEFLSDCLQAAFEHGNAVPALPPIESFRYMEDDASADADGSANATGNAVAKNRPIDRQCLRSLQTPQCARLLTLYEAWQKAAAQPKAERTGRFTDEATVLEFSGEAIHLCQGAPHNLKITQAHDLKWAEWILTSGLNEVNSEQPNNKQSDKPANFQPAPLPHSAAEPKVILGIDPGTLLMGYGLVEVCGSRLRFLNMGVLDLRKEDDPLVKLSRIHAEVNRLIDEYKPAALSIESPFYGKNAQSLIKLGRAQGVAIAAAMARGLRVFEYAPLRIKQSITGNGNASKEQVYQMLCRLLSLYGDHPKHLDASDALGAAVCHALQNRFEDRMANPGGRNANGTPGGKGTNTNAGSPTRAGRKTADPAAQIKAAGVSSKSGGHKKKPSSWESFLNQNPDRIR